MKFTVTRSKWLHSNLYSYLLHPKDSTMCCLGFLAKACGASDEQLLGQSEPHDVPEVNWPLGFLVPEPDAKDEFDVISSEIVLDIMHVNDNGELAQPEQEQELIKLFSQIGIELSFED